MTILVLHQDVPPTFYNKIVPGADIPKGLRSRYSATAIINHVAREMRQKISQQIIKEDGKVSILIDESTTLSTRTTLIV